MRKTDGSGGQSQTETDAAIRLLRDDFIGHGISLSVIGVGEIYNTTLYNFSNFFTDCNGDGISDELDCDGDGKFDSFHPNSHLDGIDIYLFDNSVLNSGLASGIPGKALVIGGRIYGATLVNSHILSHELGHCIGLFHTFHGLCEESSVCDELVSGLNGEHCGDFVPDTSADPQRFQVTTSCTWNGSTCGISSQDSNGQVYVPDVTNIMAYTRPQCMSAFTQGQGKRMRDYLENSALLQSIISNRCTEISSISHLCPSRITFVSLTNVGSATTTWTSSPNVQIVSSTNTSATIQSRSSSSGRGWRATLSNGVVLTEEFRVVEPIVRFADTSLNEALLNPSENVNVNYSAVTI